MTIWAKWVDQDQRFLFMGRDNGGIEITVEEHAALLDGQTAGKRIGVDANGAPVLIDPPPLTPEEAAAIERTWRDAKLAATDGDVTRHRDELEEGAAMTLTVEQYSALQVYRRQLRDWPENGEFPLIDHRPVAPSWLFE
ncbi:phage tail assembly chaperone [Pseudomonas baetica]|uniref:phage tail assembly chaperone n=1 Tax=Pseudomonas baetica TaxID=674054 RepID=UPI003EE8587B